MNSKLKRYFIAALPSNKGAAICDIGCGFGQTLKGLMALGFTNAFGIEPSEEAVSYCRRAGLKVELANVQHAIERGLSGVDFAYMLHVLEHINKQEVVSLLRGIRESLLGPSGRLFVAVPNAQSNTGPYWRYEDWTHETLFTSGSLLYVLKAAGFSKVELHDVDCMMDARHVLRPMKAAFRKYYAFKYLFWNWVTASSTHKGGTNVFSYEVKAIAYK